MPGCEAFAARLSALVDGELDAVERARVEAHLDACAACRGLLADLRDLRRRAARLDVLKALAYEGGSPPRSIARPWRPRDAQQPSWRSACRSSTIALLS